MLVAFFPRLRACSIKPSASCTRSFTSPRIGYKTSPRCLPNSCGRGFLGGGGGAFFTGGFFAFLGLTLADLTGLPRRGLLRRGFFGMTLEGLLGLPRRGFFPFVLPGLTNTLGGFPLAGNRRGLAAILGLTALGRLALVAKWRTRPDLSR